MLSPFLFSVIKLFEVVNLDFQVMLGSPPTAVVVNGEKHLGKSFLLKMK